MKQTRDWIQLSMVDGLGPNGFWALVTHFGSPGAALAASGAEWQALPGLRWRQVPARGAIIAGGERVDRELAALADIGGRAVSYPDPDYPSLLRSIACPPPVLYLCGRSGVGNTTAVAIIGSRAATSYGRRTAHRLAMDLGGRGVTVVSGLAQGIDAEAHAGCLAGGGFTVAVLGCGLDVVYPRINGRLYRLIAEAGLLVSEYPLGTKPEGFRFPARNRIIAGLSRGVVVVEAARRSGTLITVQHALEEGREVFAVPGQVDSAKSAGSHWLLQQGAGLVVCADDIAEGLGLPSSPVPKQETAQEAGAIDSGAAQVLALLEPYPLLRDDLLRRSGLGSARLSELLLMLELAGCVEILPGDRVRRIDTAACCS
ncbi:DNA-processing protein DprA [Desulfofustis glycolicus]|uniref:DNA processing protein n=1 Tax=Desulfofustis glycolicus DSM 9705 TaxID=1121409 RepID=A0A1M5UXJ1_9BACT|nr:DNA-processing protein DprA [Desulfofustis glycolicus]SHH67413.1 DNA processing protein [Desulfofustis glycolicus DSM 9705]